MSMSTKLSHNYRLKMIHISVWSIIKKQLNSHQHAQVRAQAQKVQMSWKSKVPQTTFSYKIEANAPQLPSTVAHGQVLACKLSWIGTVASLSSSLEPRKKTPVSFPILLTSPIYVPTQLYAHWANLTVNRVIFEEILDIEITASHHNCYRCYAYDFLIMQDNN